MHPLRPSRRTRNKIVFGSGQPNAKLVFVGEGPGADEDAQGLPFVGRAGQLLTQMIDNTAKREGIPISREDVYICNVVKCRPPGNRNPEPDEMKNLRPVSRAPVGGHPSKSDLRTRRNRRQVPVETDPRDHQDSGQVARVAWDSGDANLSSVVLAKALRPG